MPIRHRSHELEQISRNKLRQIFTQVGWVTEDLVQDYGEDFFVRIFNEGKTTPYCFFVQAKATEHIDRYVSKDGKSIKFPVDREHFQHWFRFSQPVILTIWDASSDVTYWKIIQDVSEKVEKKSQKSIKINIPVFNILNETSCKYIYYTTRLRYKRLEYEKEGAEVLINVLKDLLKVEIEYDPQGGLLMIDEADGNNTKLYIFGTLGKLLQKFIAQTGQTPEEAITGVLRKELGLDSQYENTDSNSEMNATSEVIEIYESYDDYLNYLRVQNNLAFIDEDN